MSPFVVFLIIALIFFMIEIYTPTMFFLNFALAAGICAFFALGIENYNILVPIFVILSILFLLFLRPLFDLTPKKSAEKSFESPYIGKQATAITDINFFTGRAKIYDEDWEARTLTEDAPTIKKGTKINIVRHDDLTLFVEKKGKK